MHFCQYCNVYVHVAAVMDHEMGSTHQDKVRRPGRGDGAHDSSTPRRAFIKLEVVDDCQKHGWRFRVPPSGLSSTYNYNMCFSFMKNNTCKVGVACRPRGAGGWQVYPTGKLTRGGQYGRERCTHAHSHEELEEWIERRRVLALGDRCGLGPRRGCDVFSPAGAST